MSLTRHSTHLLNPTEILRRIFVPLSTFASPYNRHDHRPKLLLSRFPHRQANNWARPPPKASKSSRRHDEEIDERLVQLVSEDSDSLLPPESPRSILARMDRKTNFLVEVAGATGTGLPVCRILPKKGVREYEKAKRQKPRSRSNLMKMLELNWAIEPNDLKHKLDKMKGFLEEGRKVELTIAKKRRGRDATEGEKAKLLDFIKKFAQGLVGVKEYKAIEWIGKKKEREGEEGEEGEEQVQVQARKKPRQETAILFYEGIRKPELRKKGRDVDDDGDVAT